MIHPDTEVRRVDDVVGVGVFATALIPRGTLTWALDPLDQLLTPERLLRANIAQIRRCAVQGGDVALQVAHRRWDDTPRTSIRQDRVAPW